ncbi:MAG: cell division protein ZapA [Hydrogenophilales bacterium CG03_land_8_20_14_0_80_62_28]|nr:cell division protein ZapA [Betaproteobacteria bacterium]OIO79694.1 MAG: cell division protein ZapA [Hydrogenophilaceae bacterium CG1_02_62_390]PIV23521.1 MAG: cell division protein ZapA [Hydrogenophilales bacterium CG03_land_8_20_14_0_80_62_28]PIW38775.1 MAG: cell division protein ZapA [Hydrogenophilales bacterium CG15_BIG_FIL_POST_REV_8_21_14_020_62_31]PIW71724.1 MAG: cell division protein ZapA [Hydrogenophilales bacterium CG12_big_fil_rev_8_21_14_0_65_61_21]PIX00736.1 MAG: cell division 
MPPAKNVSLDVTIMGREFRVSCPENEKLSLMEAAGYLDKKMREIRDSGKVIGIERIAIMAALNIAHDYLNAQPADPDSAEVRSRIERIGGLLDKALAQQDNLF